MLQYLLAEETAVNVRIDFRRPYLFVSQHGLDGTQVRPAFEQVGGKGVTQGVRGDVFRDACAFSINLQVVEDRDAGEVLAAAVADEDVVLLTRLDLDVAAVGKPKFKFVDSPRRDGDEALLAAFAQYTDEALL